MSAPDLKFTSYEKLSSMASQVANTLDSKDGKQNGKIDESIWNQYAQENSQYGLSSINKKSISISDATKLIATKVIARIQAEVDIVKSYKDAGRPLANTEQKLLSEEQVLNKAMGSFAPKEQSEQSTITGEPVVTPEDTSVLPKVAQVGSVPKSPDTGNIVSIRNQDETSYQIDTKAQTITKYDRDGNVVEQRAMTAEEKALSTQDLINKLQTPATPMQQTTVVAEQPVEPRTTGNIVSVRNEDGTSYQINAKEQTITKYDRDGNVVEQRAMTAEEKALSTQDLINKLQTPAAHENLPDGDDNVQMSVKNELKTKYNAGFKTRVINGKPQEYAIYKNENGETIRQRINEDGSLDNLIVISNSGKKQFVSETSPLWKLLPSSDL